jgi:hypothetical protein
MSTHTITELQEATHNSRPLRVDREKCVIHGCKFLGRFSENGREYSDPALKGAANLMEGKSIYVDHDEPKARRSLRDKLGTGRNVSVQSDGNYGDFHYNPKHELTESILWAAENDPNSLGFSMNGKGRTVRKGKTVLVESVDLVRSLDLVAEPATTAGLFESRNPDTDTDDLEEGKDNMADTLTKLTLDQIRSDRPDLLEELKESLQLDEKSKELEKQLATLQEQLNALQAEKANLTREQEIVAELQEAKLDPTDKRQCSDVFMVALRAAKDKDARKPIIADRVELVEGIRNSQPHTTGKLPPPRTPISASRYGNNSGGTAVGATTKDRISAWSR